MTLSQLYPAASAHRFFVARLIFALAAADKTHFLTRVASLLAEHEVRIPFFGAGPKSGVTPAVLEK